MNTETTKALERLNEVFKSCPCRRPQAHLGDICARCHRPYITERTYSGFKPCQHPREDT